MNSITLNSNFLDYYDHYFSNNTNDSIVFERFNHRIMDRMETFDYLNKELKLPTPVYGSVEDLVDDFREEGVFDHEDIDIKLVIYKDLYSSEKVLVTLDEAIDNYMSSYASIYIPHRYDDVLISTRYIYICGSVHWVNYENEDINEWRSTYGKNTSSYYVGLDSMQYPSNGHTMFAVDFLPTNDGLVAIDFTLNPRIWGTGIENEIRSFDMYRMIHDHLTIGGEGYVKNYIKRG